MSEQRRERPRRLHAAPAKSSTDTQSSSTRTILLATDHDSQVFLWKFCIERGHNVLCPTNVSQALDFLEMHAIDAIVSSPQFDETRFFELLQLAKSDDRYKHIPFIFIRTADNDELLGILPATMAEAARLLGADLYVDYVKLLALPNAHHELINRIEICMQATNKGDYDDQRRLAQRDRENIESLREKIQNRREELDRMRVDLLNKSSSPATESELTVLEKESNGLRRMAMELCSEAIAKYQEVNRLRTLNHGESDELQTAAEKILKKQEDAQTFTEAAQTLKEEESKQ